MQPHTDQGNAGKNGFNGSKNGRKSGPAGLPVDLANHFLECGKIGRYLTVADESRFVVTDDFGAGAKMAPVATAAASVFSRDSLVAQAALIPLGLRASRTEKRKTERFEELFTLIEKTAFSQEVRDSAEQVLKAGFREARIRDLERELGGTISPARVRYRSFLDVIRQLMEKRISAEGFRDEFLEFTRAVAGKLDFGIYSFCLDRIFTNSEIPMNAKGALVAEILLFPTLIRRELLTNILSQPKQDRRFVDFVRGVIEREMENDTVVEIYLLVTLKSSRLSLREVEDMFLDPAYSAPDRAGADALRFT